MFFIIGKINTKEESWRVLDTVDSEITDVTEIELISLIENENVEIQNAQVVNKKLQGVKYSLDRYGIVGDELVYVILEDLKGGYLVTTQNGNIIELTDKELNFLAKNYSIANREKSVIHTKFGEFVSYKENNKMQYEIELLINSESKFSVNANIFVDTRSNTFLLFEYGDIEYQILLNTSQGRTRDYLYMFGFLEGFEIHDDLWDRLDSKNIGIKPYLGVLVEYSVKNKKFNSAVAIVNPDRYELYNLKLRRRGYCDISSISYGESNKNLVKKLNIDMQKNKLEYV